MTEQNIERNEIEERSDQPTEAQLPTTDAQSILLEEGKDGLSVQELLEALKIAADTVHAVADAPALNYLREQLSELPLDQIITWDEIRDQLGSQITDILIEGGKEALGWTFVEKALRASQLYRDHKALIDAILSYSRDDARQLISQAYDELHRADADGVITQQELSDIALSTVYEGFSAALHDRAVRTAVIEEMEAKFGVNLEDPVSVATFLTNLVIDWATSTETRSSSAGVEFALSVLALTMGEQAWEEFRMLLATAAPSIQSVTLFGLSAPALFVENFAAFISEPALTGAAATVGVFAEFKRLFGLDAYELDKVQSALEDINGSYGMTIYQKGVMWDVYAFGSVALAVTADPRNSLGTCVRFESTKMVSPAARSAIGHAVGSWNAIAHAVVTFPAMFESLERLTASIEANENRIQEKIIDAINQWTPIVARKAAVAGTAWFIRLLLGGLVSIIQLRRAIERSAPSDEPVGEPPAINEAEPSMPLDERAGGGQLSQVLGKVGADKLVKVADPREGLPQGVDVWYPGRGLDPYFDM